MAATRAGSVRAPGMRGGRRPAPSGAKQLAQTPCPLLASSQFATVFLLMDRQEPPITVAHGGWAGSEVSPCPGTRGGDSWRKQWEETLRGRGVARETPMGRKLGGAGKGRRKCAGLGARGLGPVFLSNTHFALCSRTVRGRGGHLASFPAAQRLARCPVLMDAGGRRAKAPRSPCRPVRISGLEAPPPRLLLWRGGRESRLEHGIAVCVLLKVTAATKPPAPSKHVTPWAVVMWGDGYMLVFFALFYRLQFCWNKTKQNEIGTARRKTGDTAEAHNPAVISPRAWKKPGPEEEVPLAPLPQRLPLQ